MPLILGIPIAVPGTIYPSSRTYSVFSLPAVDATKPDPVVIGDMCLAIDTGLLYFSSNGTTWTLKGPPTGTGYAKVSSGVFTAPIATIPASDVTGLGSAAFDSGGDFDAAGAAAAAQAAAASDATTKANAAQAASLPVAGTAAKATILATARNINGVAFDGSAPITVAADGSTLIGSVLAAGLIGAAATKACAGNDARLSDARAPTAHTHPESEITNLVADLALKAPLASPTFTGTVVLPAATVTPAMQANMATASLVYRKTAGSGAPEVNTLATVKTDLALAKGDVGLGNVDNTSDASKPVSTAEQAALNLKANLASPTFTGTVGLPAGQALVTPAIGAATGASLAVTGALTSSGGGIGYAAGAGGAVTQLTSKATNAPTINKVCGQITTHNAALAAGAIVSFLVPDNLVLAGDMIDVQHESGGTLGAYTVQANTVVGATSFKITIRNNTAGSLSEALVIKFAVKRAVSA